MLNPHTSSTSPRRSRRRGEGAVPRRRTLLTGALCIAAALLFIPSAASASGPPLITSTSFSAVTPTGATLEASLNPNGVKISAYRFEYVDQVHFDAEGFASPQRTPDQTLSTGSQPVPVSAQIEGLTPQTQYRFRLFAKNSQGTEATGPEVTFYTLSPPPVFAACPNDEFRSGTYAPPGHPSAALPDCRVYEQASPTEKNGGDALGLAKYSIAAETGAAITFGTTFGFPGSAGAQEFPFYQATRGPGTFGWSTAALLPAASAGQNAQSLIGYLPDLSATFAEATRLGEPRMSALLELRPGGAPPTTVVPYMPDFEFYAYAGAAEGGETVLFEALDQISQTEAGPPLPGSIRNAPNVYAWDRQSGRLSLASVLNTPDQTKAALPKGAHAGPYGWADARLDLGGAFGQAGGYYLLDTHAVSSTGDVFFTSVSTGALYQRLNPTAEQSVVINAGEPDEQCTEAAKACTIELSAPELGVTDPAGPAPAAFLDASEDGKTAYFTSSQKLTADANTGPVQPSAKIGRALPEAPDPPSTMQPNFLPAHAVGLAVDPAGEYLYWANPLRGTIGRANLKAPDPEATLEPDFILTGKTSFETHPKSEPGVITTSPSTPRYVAVGPCAGGGDCVFWSNPGPLAAYGGANVLVNGAGTIGRAQLDGSGDLIPGSVKPDFITGAADPQGIAVNSEHVYWANKGDTHGQQPEDLNNPFPSKAIGRANLDGSGVDQDFITNLAGSNDSPIAVALSANQIYVSEHEDVTEFAKVFYYPLEGGQRQGGANARGPGSGLAIVGSYVYWTAGAEGTIGRRPISDLNNAFCGFDPSCEPEFLTAEGVLAGLATDGEHIYWTANGESLPNPGSDLYRYSADSSPPLIDLTPDPAAADGAQVQGVLAASTDGSYLYFAANGVLAANAVQTGDGPTQAQPGDCHGSTLATTEGHCNLYLYHAGQTSFIAPLAAEGSEDNTDILNWAPSPHVRGSHARTARASADGQTLLFRSQERLTAYDNHGVAELYRYRVGSPSLSCVSCPPSGAPPLSPPSVDSPDWPSGVGMNPSTKNTEERQPRFLSVDGDRAFFGTTEALLPADTNGSGEDVYEWEAPGKGSCEEGAPGYSPLDEGCLYLLSTGASPEPSTFAEASASGEDVYILTRQPLVGADEDRLQDVYDAREYGGLAVQNPLAEVSCEAEGCKPQVTGQPQGASPLTPNFHGPPNPIEKPCPKGKVRRNGKCVAQQHRKKHHRKHRKPHHTRRSVR